MSKLQKSIKIDGMTCVNCAMNVERAVKKAGIDNAVINFATRELIIEDYTGTWCGWCPRVSQAIDLVEDQSDKVFAIAAHIGDGMENNFATSLKDAFGVTGYPTAWVNRVSEWTYPEPNNVAQAVNQAQGTTDSGLAVNSLLSGNNISIVVSTGFAQAASGTKLVVFILEDEIVASQTNYTSYYGGGSTLPNFVHNHVLRHSLTNVMGDAISTGVGVDHTSYSLTVPSTVAKSSDSNKARRIHVFPQFRLTYILKASSTKGKRFL